MVEVLAVVAVVAAVAWFYRSRVQRRQPDHHQALPPPPDIETDDSDFDAPL